MPRIQPLSTGNITPEINSAFNRHITQHGSRITNMKATMGRSVLTFNIYMLWYDLYEQVKKIVGERPAYLFAYAISVGSNCPLCTTYFRKAIIENDEDPAHLILTEKEQQLLNFGGAIAINKGEVPDEVYAPIAAQYSEEEIIVLTGFAGQMIATNVFSNVMQVDIDEYLAPYIGITKSKE